MQRCTHDRLFLNTLVIFEAPRIFDAELQICMLSRKYINSVSLLLCLTAFLKVGSVLSNVAYLKLSDPVFSFLDMRELLLLAAFVEFLLAVYLLWEKNIVRALTCIAFFSIILLLYRVGSFWVSPAEPCPCLGRLGDWIHIKPSTADKIAKTLLAYFLCGSGVFLGLNIFARKQSGIKQSKLV